MRDADMERTLRRLAIEAGRAILRVYASTELDVRAKSDDSPVTEADLAADQVICAGLRAAFPDIAVVTEERAASHDAPGDAPHFLVDPLDGTKEFIQRRGEFTVNIALIEQRRPTAGIVYAPAVGRLFRTQLGGGAVEETGAFDLETEGSTSRLSAADPSGGPLLVVASKSHRDAATDEFISRYDVAGFRAAGSSLKFCMVASGEAHLYPRFGPTMEWDTAAGQAVLEAAGGRVVRSDDLKPFRYGKPGRRNPGFVAAAPGVALDLDRN